MDYSQPGIYDVQDLRYGVLPGTLGTGSGNSSGLQMAINDAESNGGGIILIPSNDPSNSGDNRYPFQRYDTSKSYCVSISGEYPILFLGTGGSPVLDVQDDCDLFYVAPGGAFTGPSLSFQDFSVHYQKGKTGTAFNLSACQCVHFFRMQITDAPTGINFQNVQQGSVKQSVISFSTDYTKSFPAMAVEIGPDSSGVASTQIELSSCTFFVSKFTTLTSTTVGIEVTAVNGLRVESVHVAGFNFPVKVAPPSSLACSDIWLSYLQMDSPNGVLVQPVSDSSGIVTNVTIDNCVASYTGSGASTAGITIDVNGNAADQIQGVQVLNCTVFGYNNYGVAITGGEKLAIAGGVYASNGECGILVAGAAADVTINGTAMGQTSYGSSVLQPVGLMITNSGSSSPSGVYVNGCIVSGHATGGVMIENGATLVTVRNCVIVGNSSGAPYGVSVSNACSSVYVDGCNLTGNAGGALVVSSPGTLQVTNCPGYNDQVHTSTSLPTSGSAFNGETAPYGYYGPVSFYLKTTIVSPPTTVYINGYFTHRPVGVFLIGPPAPSGGETATINYASAPGFLLVGQ